MYTDLSLAAVADAVAADLTQTDTDSLSAVSLVYLRPLLAEIDRVGADRQALFLGLSLQPGDFDSAGFLASHREATTVVRRALQLLTDGDQQLGIAMGRNSRLTDRGALGLGMLAAPTLAHAGALALRYPRNAGYLVNLRLQRGAGRQAFRAETLPNSRDLAPFLVDMTFASIVQMCRHVADPNFAPIAVELTRPRPADPRPYGDHFRCAVQFGQAQNRLVADASWIDPPLPMANTMSYRLCCGLLERETQQAVLRPAIGLAVERAIQRAWPRVATPADVAAGLHLSERTLRRRLDDEGLRFSGLLDDCRRLRALDLMADGSLQLKAVAAATGFADTSTFRRAFKRWTGGAPQALQSDPVTAGAQAG